LDDNIFIGTSMGGGKTICAEFALMRLWSKHESLRAPYQEMVGLRGKNGK
jgi:pre-mRNA-splicing helicase BRR2